MSRVAMTTNMCRIPLELVAMLRTWDSYDDSCYVVGGVGFVDIQSVYPRTADCRLLSM